MKKIILVCLMFGGYLLHAAPAVDIVSAPGELNAFLTGGHVQGFTCSSNALYLSQAAHLAKLDWDGHVLKVIEVPSHLGDISYLNGRVYGAFGLRGKRTGGLVRVWDENLEQVAEVALAEGTGALCATPGGIFYSLGMGLQMKKPHRVNRIGRMTLDLKPLDIVDVDYGYDTVYGVQSMGWCGDELICTFYGVKPKEGSAHPTARFDRSTLKALGADTFAAGEGFDFVPPSRRLSDVPEVLAVRALNGNYKKWSPENPPQVRLERWRYEKGRFVRVNKPDKRL